MDRGGTTAKAASETVESEAETTIAGPLRIKLDLPHNWVYPEAANISTSKFLTRPCVTETGGAAAPKNLMVSRWPVAMQCTPKLSPIKSQKIFGLLDKHSDKPDNPDSNRVYVVPDRDPLDDRYFVKLSDTTLEHKVLDDNQRHLSINKLKLANNQVTGSESLSLNNGDLHSMFQTNGIKGTQDNKKYNYPTQTKMPKRSVMSNSRKEMPEKEGRTVGLVPAICSNWNGATFLEENGQQRQSVRSKCVIGKKTSPGKMKTRKKEDIREILKRIRRKKKENPKNT